MVQELWVPPAIEILHRTPDSDTVRNWTPKTELGRTIRKILPSIAEPELRAELVAAISRVAVIETSLSAKVFRNLGLKQMGFDVEVIEEDYGVVSCRVVTDTGVGFIVDAFQNLTELENMKYHGIGTGGTAEAASQTALVTELTTEYNPNSTRATGSTTEFAANIYQTVGTNTIDSGTPAITEHMVASQAATGGGVMLDRSLFSAINLVGANGDGLQTDYRFTITSGG